MAGENAGEKSKGMTPDDFTKIMERLESVLIVTDQQRQDRGIRWEEAFELLEPFTVEEFQYAKEELEKTSKFLPTLSDLYSACVEARDALAPANGQSSKYAPAEHKCSKKDPEKCFAWRLLSVANAYEAKHILCPSSVPATCPVCGRLHMEKDVHAEMMRVYPEGTEKWNPNYKGMMLCEKCAKKQ